MNYFHFSLPDFAFAFLSILLEGIPFILLGTLISGFLDAFLPSKLMTRILPKNPLLAILACGGMGLVFPMCECGIVPVIRRLMRKGLPVSCGIAYMLSAPIVNPVVAISTFAAFKGQDAGMMTLMRLGTGFLVAVLVAMVVDRIATRHVLKKEIPDSLPGPHSDPQPHGETPAAIPLRAKITTALTVATKDFLDVSMYLVIGAAITSIFNTAVDQSLILPLALNPALAIASLMGLAGILSLCSTSDAFIAATFIAFPPAAKLAFLVYGPMMDLKLLFLYTYVFKKRFVAAMAIGLFILIGLICLRINSFIY